MGLMVSPERNDSHTYATSYVYGLLTSSDFFDSDTKTFVAPDTRVPDKEAMISNEIILTRRL